MSTTVKEMLSKNLAANINALDASIKSANQLLKSLQSTLSAEADEEPEAEEEETEEEETEEEPEAEEESEEEETEEEPVKKKAGAKGASSTKPKKTDVIKALQAYSTKHSRPKAMAKLKKFGVDTVHDLEPEQYAELIALLK